MSSLLRPNGRPLPVRPVDFPHWFSTRQVCAQEGSLFQGLPTWRYRVLKTALRLRPRRALSSAPGQKPFLNTTRWENENFKFRTLRIDKPHTRSSRLCGFMGLNLTQRREERREATN